MIPANSGESRRLRVAVLSGGDSSEREISLQSGQAVANALSERGHTVVIVDPGHSQPEAAHFRDVDVAFLALHGRGGEDGQIQTLLDRMGVFYPGSGPEASRLAFSKSASKERFFQSQVPTPPYVLVHESDSPTRVCEQALRIGFPLVVKPDTQGSSLGVSLVESLEALPEALKNCFRYDSFGLLETAIAGTEWTLPLLDDDPLPLIQIETQGVIFDFTAKYHDERTVYHFHSPEDAFVARLTETGQSAAKAIGTKGLVRVDLRVDHHGRPWIPGSQHDPRPDGS